jgi:thiamine-monophosphate kinase
MPDARDRGAKPPSGDEFSEIARLFRPLTGGAAGAFDLLDDAAIVPQRPGFDLVVTKDAIVEGVHFPAGERPDLIAKKLLRVNLSDLAAKAAEPFARGLGEDLKTFGLVLLGGDTVSTPGPFTASLTALGWVPEGRMVRRAGAKPGDTIAISGTIGDGTLGLAAARGEIEDSDGWLAARFRLPTPRLDLREDLRARASAAADISDGLIADAGHIARASGVGLRLDLDAMPLSPAARRWLDGQSDRTAAVIRLGTGGDDYEVVATFAGDVPPGFTACGAVVAGKGVEVRVDGRAVEVAHGGWRHL